MTNYITQKTFGDTDWFEASRFGMFIHFGLYALPARHEWIKFYERIPEDKYQKYFDNFNPDMFDARQWAQKAKSAGMKYVVFTTKHHEGFCLFDTKYTDYKVTNTPYGKDLLREFVEAFRAEGIRIGFYYSLLDWHHPHFPIDCIHPRCEDADAEAQDKGRDMKIYAEYMRNQVTELLTNYGDVDILWFDFSYTPESQSWQSVYKPWMQFGGGKGKDEWESEKLIATARSLQPNILIDNRADILQDIWTPEQYQPSQWVCHPHTGKLVTWEACHTMSGSWGYFRDEMTWKSPEQLINLLIDSVALGGNLIMNVGPTARGYFDQRADDALSVYTEWMKYNSRSIYSCTMAEPEFRAPFGTRLTQSTDSKRLYIHLQKYPFGILEADNLTGRIEYAQFLHDGSEILFTENSFAHLGESTGVDCKGKVYFHLPHVKPDVIVPVIEIILK